MTDVTQADRDAAALIVVVQELRKIIREGGYDEHDYVQDFARHREVAAAEERSRIVAWLREWKRDDTNWPGVIANRIEAGEYMQEMLPPNRG